MESIFTTNNINSTLVLAIGYSLYRIWTLGNAITNDGIEPLTPRAPQQPIVLKNYTPTQLIGFNGVRSDLIYMAVKGYVFDVSRGRSFYGPEGPYGNFAGRDASRGLAKHSFELCMLAPIQDDYIDPLDDLSMDELDILNDWLAQFHSKYPHVGFLVLEQKS